MNVISDQDKRQLTNYIWQHGVKGAVVAVSLTGRLAMLVRCEDDNCWPQYMQRLLELFQAKKVQFVEEFCMAGICWHGALIHLEGIWEVDILAGIEAGSPEGTYGKMQRLRQFLLTRGIELKPVLVEDDCFELHLESYLNLSEFKAIYKLVELLDVYRLRILVNREAGVPAMRVVIQPDPETFKKCLKEVALHERRA